MGGSTLHTVAIESEDLETAGDLAAQIGHRHSPQPELSDERSGTRCTYEKMTTWASKSSANS